MSSRVMTLNSVERIEAKWGVEQFALVQTSRRYPQFAKVITLNLAEAQALIQSLAEFIEENTKGKGNKG